MSAVHDLLDHIEGAFGRLAQEIERDASVVVQWASGDWAKLKQLVSGVRAEVGASPDVQKVEEISDQPEPAAEEHEDATVSDEQQ